MEGFHPLNHTKNHETQASPELFTTSSSHYLSKHKSILGNLQLGRGRALGLSSLAQNLIARCPRFQFLIASTQKEHAIS
jgi:hypothetical protein